MSKFINPRRRVIELEAENQELRNQIKKLEAGKEINKNAEKQPSAPKRDSELGSIPVLEEEITKESDELKPTPAPTPAPKPKKTSSKSKNTKK